MASNILLLTATINSLSTLVKSRPTIVSRIVNAILQCEPYAIAKLPITVKTKIELRSIERTIRVLLTGILRRLGRVPVMMNFAVANWG
jgi:symplekin